MSTSITPVIIAGKDTDMAAAIRGNLDLACDLKTPVFIDFLYGDQLLFQNSGIFGKSDSGKIIVRLNRTPRFILNQGTKLHVYFFLPSRPKRMPFDFLSELAVPMREGEERLITLRMPEQMTHYQRRFNNRLRLDAQDIQHFKVWCCDIAPATSDADPPRSDWLRVEPDLVRIHDISAGGVRLTVAKTSSRHSLLVLKAPLLINGVFPWRGKDPIKLILAGRIVRLVSGGKSPDTEIGLSFNRWARLEAEDSQWQRIADKEDGVTPLVTWIAQMEAERNKAGLS